MHKVYIYIRSYVFFVMVPRYFIGLVAIVSYYLFSIMFWAYLILM